ncbi:MAG: Radical SAM superfamily enzyme with C-terminal helix-hairpin-helix motif [Candidatus Alkanophagales archaeon MCA70_species_2]|nr:Radical SAM superfamily enzyme with C-terminal helix-hairpin-helix motif [Candidatus Alkanophaga liquidiphilum]
MLNYELRMNVIILDGYVDEPTCLGVPPYISPYVRYAAGAALKTAKELCLDLKLLYFTIDQLRSGVGFKEIIKADLLVVICGTAVPGKYLGGTPASSSELARLLSGVERPVKVLGGPAAKFGFGTGGGRRAAAVPEGVFDIVATGDVEFVISQLIAERLSVERVAPEEHRESVSQIRNFAIYGAEIVRQHPNFPHIIAELETYRGCARSLVGGCSFCVEPNKGLPDFRPVEDVVDEVAALYKVGVRHFRFGSQPCLFSYMAEGVGELEFPKPNSEALERLYRGIRAVAPKLRTLHMDNANPGTLAAYPEECRRIAKIIVKYHTAGDVVALGVESADPEVVRRNNLKAMPEDCMKAIELLNEVGARRGENGLPELLPGVNFVFGLLGETKKTYELNYEFLREVLERRLLLRRINLRQVMIFPTTRMAKVGDRIMRRHKRLFRSFKRRVREEIDREMLKRVVPRGVVLRDVLTEMHEGKTTFGRQLGTYPLLVGIPGVYELRRFLDVKVVDYGFRSITAVPFPLDVNTAPKETLMALPGVGERRAAAIERKRPFKSVEDFVSAFDDKAVGEKLREYVKVL